MKDSRLSGARSRRVCAVASRSVSSSRRSAAPSMLTACTTSCGGRPSDDSASGSAGGRLRGSACCSGTARLRTAVANSGDISGACDWRRPRSTAAKARRSCAAVSGESCLLKIESKAEQVCGVSHLGRPPAATRSASHASAVEAARMQQLRQTGLPAPRVVQHVAPAGYEAAHQCERRALDI